MTTNALRGVQEAHPTTTPIGFVLADNRLVTIRYAQPKSFALFIAALQRIPQERRTGVALLAKLLETIVDRTAEVLEQTVASIDILSVHGGRPRRKSGKATRATGSRIGEQALCVGRG